MKFLKIALVLTPVALTVGYAISFFGSEAALIERHPNLPAKEVARAHRQMFRSALTGELNSDQMTDEQLDEILIQLVQINLNK